MYVLCEVRHMNTLQAAAIETVIMCDALRLLLCCYLLSNLSLNTGYYLQFISLCYWVMITVSIASFSIWLWFSVERELPESHFYPRHPTRWNGEYARAGLCDRPGTSFHLCVLPIWLFAFLWYSRNKSRIANWLIRLKLIFSLISVSFVSHHSILMALLFVVSELRSRRHGYNWLFKDFFVSVNCEKVSFDFVVITFIACVDHCLSAL